MKGFRPTGYGPSAGFKFPARMGFTGSTGGYTNVQPYVRRKPQQFAEGGFVRQDNPRMKSDCIGDQGSAMTRRKRPYAEWQRDVGATSSLLPGFKDGGKNWIAGATKNKGALHRALHVPEGEKIPAKKLAKAANSDNPKMRKRAALAKTLGKMHKANGGRVGVAPKPSTRANPQPLGPKRSQPKPSPGLAIKTKFYDEGGKVVRGSSAKSFTESVKDIPKFIKMLIMQPKIASDPEKVVSGRERQIDRIVDEAQTGESRASNYALGGLARKPMLQRAVSQAATNAETKPAAPQPQTQTTRLLQKALNTAATKPAAPSASPRRPYARFW
jgi:hypothetical protein